MSPEPYFSVVLPCRNQADHIAEVLRAYAGPLDTIGRPYELVVVPNASTDHTADVVRALAEQDARICVAENPQGGWGRSVLLGLRQARGAVLCYTNSARTDPARIPPLLARHEQDPQCAVKICRTKRQAPLREIGSLLYNLEGRLLFGVSSPDVNGTPKVFSRTLYQRLGLQAEDDLLDLEFMARAHGLGVRVVEVPAEGFRRHGGKSSTNLGSAWRMYCGAMQLRWRLFQARWHTPVPCRS